MKQKKKMKQYVDKTEMLNVRNRLSAQLSRERVKCEVDFLESQTVSYERLLLKLNNQ